MKKKYGREFALRSWVYDSYERKKNSFAWNAGNHCVILPTVHGTSQQLAENICETGFHALVTQDNGWFGKGIYFTTNTCVVPEIIDCIIISHVLTGEIYPVIGTEASLLHGAPLKKGYDCHYVLTNTNGKAPTKKIVQPFDEIVIDQDSQIAPAFIIYVDVTKHQGL